MCRLLLCYIILLLCKLVTQFNHHFLHQCWQLHPSLTCCSCLSMRNTIEPVIGTLGVLCANRGIQSHCCRRLSTSERLNWGCRLHAICYVFFRPLGDNRVPGFDMISVYLKLLMDRQTLTHVGKKDRIFRMLCLGLLINILAPFALHISHYPSPSHTGEPE